MELIIFALVMLTIWCVLLTIIILINMNEVSEEINNINKKLEVHKSEDIKIEFQ